MNTLSQRLQGSSAWVRGLVAVGMVAGAWALSTAASEAQARDVYWSVGVSGPGVSVGASNAPVVVQQPPTYYYAPSPVVVQPAPVYYNRPPAVVYGPPVVYAPARPVVIGGYGNWRDRPGRWDGRGHGHWHGHGRGRGHGHHRYRD